MKDHIIENVQTELKDVEGRLTTLVRQLENQADDGDSKRCLERVSAAYKETYNARVCVTPELQTAQEEAKPATTKKTRRPHSPAGGGAQ